MATKSKSARKRVRTSKIRKTRNLSAKKAIKKAFLAAEKAVVHKSSNAKELAKKAVSQLDRAAQRGIIHRNMAARKKSRLLSKLSA